MADAVTDITEPEGNEDTIVLEKKIEPKEPCMPKLYEIKDIEIFKSGVHNGMTFKDADLDEIVNNFKTLKEENPTFSMPIKIGHKQDLKDGMPAAGWMDNVRKVGDSIYADFIDLPETIFKFIKLKGLKNRSVEMINNFTHSSGKKIGKVLKAIALLGCEMPAVNLNEAGKYLYGANFSSELEKIEHITIEFSEENSEDNNKDGENMEQLKGFSKEDLEGLASLVSVFNKEGLEKVIQTVKDYGEKTAVYSAEVERFKKETELRKKEEMISFTNKLITDNKIIPAEKPIVETLLYNLNDESKIEFSYTEFGIKEEDSVLNIFKRFLDSLPNRKLLEQNSRVSTFSKELDWNANVIAFAKERGVSESDLANKDTYKKYSSELLSAMEKKGGRE